MLSEATVLIKEKLVDDKNIVIQTYEKRVLIQHYYHLSPNIDYSGDNPAQHNL